MLTWSTASGVAMFGMVQQSSQDDLWSIAVYGGWMITVDLARALVAGGVLWDPRPGDRFTIDRPGVVGEVFWISELTIDVHTFHGQPLLGFNGTTEWALDSVTLDSALWLPREDQLRELLGARLESLIRSPS